jgi:glycosyltransferase involved in cell wall biosynthesis
MQPLNKYLFSIVIANYNSELYIKDVLDSVAKQTYRNIEVVIVDDKSSDNSVGIINGFIERTDLKVIFVENKVNLGGGKTKVQGLSLASGDLIAFVDCDDYIQENAVERMVQAHCENENASLIYSDAYRLDKNGNVLGLLDKARQVSAGSSILYDDCVFHFASWKKIYYDRLKSGFSGKFNIAYDLDLYYKLEEVGKVIYINEPLYNYRVHGGNLSMGFNNLGQSVTELLIAKYEAQVRRDEVDLKMVSSMLQIAFERVFTQGKNSVSLRQELKKKIKKYL